ncbi:MAG: DUF892 family protein [Cyclobacteriaceae bacterium]|nr:DUF892 family protein [Cyclobacteriaceae bacterium HetDA_MAG_MS6]
MKKISDLNELMVEQLRDLYHSETYILPYIQAFRDSVIDVTLRHQVACYEEQTHEQILRLKRVFNTLFTQKRGEACEAMQTMIKESEALLSRCTTLPVRDAAIIVALQHMIHYKIASYGAICTYAKLLELYDPLAILHENLELEKKADQRLKHIAEAIVDAKAVQY